MSPQHIKPRINLEDLDDAPSIMERCRKAARQSGWTEEQFHDFQKEATSKSSIYLLDVVHRHFEVTDDFEEWIKRAEARQLKRRK